MIDFESKEGEEGNWCSRKETRNKRHELGPTRRYFTSCHTATEHTKHLQIVQKMRTTTVANRKRQIFFANVKLLNKVLGH